MPCDTPFYVKVKGRLDDVPVPCGRCPPCKQRRVNDWVFRLLAEEKVSTSAHFVTLTYDSHSVPKSENNFMTLDKSDLQKFFKRLRKLSGYDNIKYYAVGEYGKTRKRPHYHMIVFNCGNPDYYADAWSLDGVPIGAVHVGTVSGGSAAYCMKYIDKPPDPRKHARDDRAPEFAVMSKRLGACYMSDEIFQYHRRSYENNYLVRDGGYKIAMPKYYRDMVYSDAEKRIQREIIDAAVNHQKELDRYKFHNENNNANYTYEMELSSRKIGRYKRFYAQQKQRLDI